MLIWSTAAVRALTSTQHISSADESVSIVLISLRALPRFITFLVSSQFMAPKHSAMAPVPAARGWKEAQVKEVSVRGGEGGLHQGAPTQMNV